MIEEILKKLKKDCHVTLTEDQLIMLNDIVNSNFPEFEDLMININKKCVYYKPSRSIEIPLINRYNDDILLSSHISYYESGLSLKNNDLDFSISLVCPYYTYDNKRIDNKHIVLGNMSYKDDNNIVNISNDVQDCSYFYGMLKIYENNENYQGFHFTIPNYKCRVETIPNENGTLVKLREVINESAFIEKQRQLFINNNTVSGVYRDILENTLNEYKSEKKIIRKLYLEDYIY